jgi:hypothetical protein
MLHTHFCFSLETVFLQCKGRRFLLANRKKTCFTLISSDVVFLNSIFFHSLHTDADKIPCSVFVVDFILNFVFKSKLPQQNITLFDVKWVERPSGALIARRHKWVRSTKGVEWPSSIHECFIGVAAIKLTNDQFVIKVTKWLHLIHVRSKSQECIINGVGSAFSLHHWRSIAAAAGSFVTISGWKSQVCARVPAAWFIFHSVRAGDEPILGAHYHF